MKHVHYTIRKSLFAVLDVFYPFFRRLMPLQTYHYAACGSSNTLMGLIIYHLSYNYIVQKEVLHFGPVAISPHIMALFLSTGFTLPVGFYLSMYVVFQGSYLKRRVQFFRYFLIAMGCILLNYILLKIFVEHLHWYPTLAQIANTVVVVVFSYFSQRYFSFRVQKAVPEHVTRR